MYVFVELMMENDLIFILVRIQDYINDTAPQPSG